MKIRSGNYLLCSDSLGNFHVREIRTKVVDGEEIQTEVRVSGYFKDPEAAVQDLFRGQVLGSDAQTLKELAAVIRKKLAAALEILNSWEEE